MIGPSRISVKPIAQTCCADMFELHRPLCSFRVTKTRRLWRRGTALCLASPHGCLSLQHHLLCRRFTTRGAALLRPRGTHAGRLLLSGALDDAGDDRTGAFLVDRDAEEHAVLVDRPVAVAVPLDLELHRAASVL